MKRFILGVAVLALLAFVQAQTSYKITPIPNSLSTISDGFVWDTETQSLYSVDLFVNKLTRVDSKTNRVYKADLVGETKPTFIVQIEGEKNKLVVGGNRHVTVVSWDGVSPTAKVERVLYEVEASAEFYLNEFWDGKADIKGRLVAGTTWSNQSDFYSVRKGTLYSFETGKPVKELIKNVGVSNGLTWNVAAKKFYYVDSASGTVTEYDYDFNTGDISNPRVVFEYPNFPDGMTIDTDGNLYVATWNYRLFKINPRTKEILAEILFPVQNLAGVTFGGPNLDVLYVGSFAQGQPAPAGTIYKVTGLGAKGFPPSKMVL